MLTHDDGYDWWVNWGNHYNYNHIKTEDIETKQCSEGIVPSLLNIFILKSLRTN